MFPTAVSSVDTNFLRKTFLQNMESFRTISRKDIWKIRRGGQGTNRVFRGNINGSWEKIWGISGSLMRGGSIINGDKRYMHIWATDGAVITCIQTVNKNNVGSDQWDRKETSTKQVQQVK